LPGDLISIIESGNLLKLAGYLTGKNVDCIINEILKEETETDFIDKFIEELK
jgi:hypothetical protein